MITVRVNKNPFDIGVFDEFYAEPMTVGEALKLIEGVNGDEPYLDTRVHGRPVMRDDDLRDGDMLNVCVSPGDPVSGTTLLLIQIAVAVGSLILSRLLIKTPKDTRAKDDESSSTYNFSGISQTRVEHQPVEVVFGEMRMGGTVISEFITSTFNPVTSTLHQLVSLGWGPYNEIAGQTADTLQGTTIAGSLLAGKVFINDNPIENYDDVLVQVRMGTPTQDVVEGFEQIREVFQVGPFEMTSEETDIEDNAALVAGFNSTLWYDQTNDAHWDAHANTFDVTSEFDDLVLRMTAPQGYFETSANGSLASSDFKYQVRYQELDPTNNPIITGGLGGDGWHREPPNSGIGFPSFGQQGSFDFEIRVPLFDPQTQALPVVGGSISVDLGNQTNGFVAPVAFSPTSIGSVYPRHQAANDDSGFSISVWIKKDFDLVAFDKVYICGTNPGTDDSGFTIYISSQVDPSDPARTLESIRLVLWDPVFNVSISRLVPGDTLPIGQYFHLGVRWSRFRPGNSSQGNMAITVNGVPGGGSGNVFTNTLSLPRWSGTGFSIGHSNVDPTDGSTIIPGATIQFDQFRFFNGVVTGSQFASFSDEDVGAINVPSLLWENSLWRIDDTALANESDLANSDPHWWGSLASFGTGSSFSLLSGAIETLGNSKRKKMRARVQVVRINVDSTSPRTQDSMEWVEAQGIDNVELTHPGKALLGISIRASEQLGGRIPNTTVIVKGRSIPVWDGISANDPVHQYSANPAWCALAMLEDTNWGLPGNYRANLPMLKSVADYADDIIYDGTEVVTYDGSTANVIGQNIWYDSTVLDERGVARGAIEVHIPFLDQGPVNSQIYGALPKTWTVGSFVRLAGFNGAASSVVDSGDVGGYEIYEVGIDSGTSVGVVHPVFLSVKAYYMDRHSPLPTPPISLWSGATGFYSDGSGTLRSYGLAVDPVNGVIDLGASIEGGHRRFEFNGVFDKADGGWDQLQTVLSVARAAPYRMGQEIGFRYSHPDVPSSLISQSSIIPGSFSISYGSPSSRTNALDMLILDRFDSFNSATVSEVSSRVSAPNSLNSVRRDQKELFGVTSRAQASRSAKYEINVNDLLLRTGSFEVGPTGLGYEVGDLIRIASDLLPTDRGQGGFVMNNARSSTDLIADHDITTGAGWGTSGSATVTLVQAGDSTGLAAAYSIGDSLPIALAEVTYTIPTPPAPGVYSAGFQVRRIAGSTDGYIRVGFRTDTKKYYRVIDMTSLTLGAERKETDGGAQVNDLGNGWAYVRVWFKFTPTTVGETFSLVLNPAGGQGGGGKLPVGGMDVASLSISEGKIPKLPSDDGFGVDMRGIGISIERSMTVVGDEVVHVRSALGGLSTSAGTVLNPPGSYAGSDMVFFTSPILPNPPERHDEYTFVDPLDGGAIVEVLGLEIGDGLRTKVSWIEYNADVFKDRSEDITILPLSNDDHGGIGPAMRVPAIVPIISVTDFAVRDTHGVATTRLRVSWNPAREDRTSIRENVIYTRVSGLGRWQAAGTALASDGFADLALNAGAVGDAVDVAIQPVSKTGVARHPDRCGRATFVVRGFSAMPAVPTGVTERVSGHRGLFQWTLPEAERWNAVECRRGGWILGQRVFLSSPGDQAHGPSENWVGSDFTATKLKYRCLSSTGAYSHVVEALSSPVIDVDPLVSDMTEPSKSWEDHGGANGWIAATPPTDDPKLGAEFEQDSEGSIHYKASSVATTTPFVAWTSTLGSKVPKVGRTYRESRLVYVEAYVEADQVHPETWAADTGTWRDYSADMGSWEGPVTLLHGESQASLIIEMSTNETGVQTDWSPWLPYQPGIYPIVDVMFRLVCTRPDTGYDVAIRKFHTRISAPATRLTESTPVRRMLDGELLR